MTINSDWISQLSPLLIHWSLTVLKALGVLVIGWMVSSWIANTLSESLKKLNMDTTIRRSLRSFVNTALKCGILILTISQLGVKMTLLAAVVGGLSISLGLALKGNISDIANGVLLLANKPFRAGDYIESGAASGTVERIDLLSTLLKTPNNQLVVVPNHVLTDNTLVNFNTNPTRRIELVLGISYSDNLDTSIDAIKEALKKVEGVLEDPSVDIWLTEFADSSINMSIRAWCERGDFLKVRHNVILAIHALSKTGAFSIPFPQRDIHMMSS